MNIKYFPGFVSLDVAKAFDAVWHTGLILKLQRYGIPGPLVRITHSLLSDRSFSARIGKTYFTPYSHEARVPPGAVLSPTLYSLYTADISRPEDHRVHLAAYAYDTAILAESSNANILADLLQDYLLILKSYFERWLITANAEKSSAFILCRKKRRAPTSSSLRCHHPLER